MGDERKEERSAVEVAASGAGAATPLAAAAFSAAIAATTFTIPHVDSAEGGESTTLAASSSTWADQSVTGISS
jgi:hypothetical protein